jgi:hypothetical protein
MTSNLFWGASVKLAGLPDQRHMYQDCSRSKGTCSYIPYDRSFQVLQLFERHAAQDIRTRACKNRNTQSNDEKNWMVHMIREHFKGTNGNEIEGHSSLRISILPSKTCLDTSGKANLPGLLPRLQKPEDSHQLGAMRVFNHRTKLCGKGHSLRATS